MKELYTTDDDQVRLTLFWGGRSRGTLLQIVETNSRNSDGTPVVHSISLTKQQAKEIFTDIMEFGDGNHEL